MKYTLKRNVEEPFLYCKNHIVTEVNNEFIKLTDYLRNELIGKTLNEIGSVLKLSSNISLNSIQHECSCYIFTKSCDAREVTIYCKDAPVNGEKMYFFKEKPHSRIEDNFQVINELLLDNHCGIAIHNLPDLMLLKANQYYLDFLGKPYNKKECAIGKKASELIYQWEGSSWQHICMNVINTGQCFFGKEMRGQTPNCGNYFLDNSIIPVIKNGKVTYIISIIENVTEKVLLRKNNEELNKVIEQQKEELDAIIENMSDALAYFDKNGKYIKFNKAAKKLYFHESEKIINAGDLSGKITLFDMNKQLILKENLPSLRVMNGEKLLGYRMCLKNKDNIVYVDVNGTPMYDSNDNFIGGILCYREVTEKVKYEEELLIKTQYNFLNTMIDNLDLPVLRLSYPDLEITEINQKAYNFVKGLNPEIKNMAFVKKQKYTEIIPDCNEKDIIKHIKSILDKKETSYIRNRRMIIYGKEMFLHKLYQPIIGLNNEVTEIIVIIIDVTEEIKAKRNMEKMLKKQEEFLANLSHELKTPLNIIFSAAQLFDLYLKNDSLTDNKNKASRYVNSIMQNCYRLSRLINNIVDLSKIESGLFVLNLCNKNIVNVVEEIVESVTEYIESKGMNIFFHTSIKKKIIAFDSDKIERAILNLISNAIKFSEPGSQIYVEVADAENTVVITVKDNGIVIDKAYLKDIFKRFKQVDKSFSRNAEGSGIGLCIVKSIIQLHGGKISVESQLGEGSKFKIELPARTIEKIKLNDENNMVNNSTEMINIEFSDI